MKKILLLILPLIIALNSYSQSNYSFTNVRKINSIYTDISATGTVITMSDFNSGNSVTPIEIGFPFNFSGTTFTQCMINVDGVLRFGTDAPGSHSSLFSDNVTESGSAFTTTDLNYQNVVYALFMDLVQGNAMPTFHVLTEGLTPNRITTIQWKNLKDNIANSSLNQFENLEFQVKLFETNNDIQIVYGNFLPSTNGIAGKFAQVGLKASSTSFIGAKRSSSINPFNLTEFFNPATHTIFNSSMAIRNTMPPPTGFGFIFYGIKTLDVGIAKAYVDYSVAKTANASNFNSVRVKNEGTTTATSIDVTMTITGSNTFSQTINIPTLAAGADQVVAFSNYNISNIGSQNVQFVVSTAGDERIDNNSVTKNQLVTNSFAQIFPDSQSQIAIGFNSVANNEVAIKQYGTGTRRISQIRIPFSTYLVSVALKILDDDGVGNIPGTVLHTSAARFTNADGETIFNLTTPITVTGDYYISIRQNTAVNMGWNAALQSPNVLNRIYNGFSGNFIVQTIGSPFHPILKVVEENNLADVGIIAVTNPACSYSSTNPVTVSLRNYSTSVHDFVANPVTVNGSIKNETTNTSTPFSVVKNTGTLAAGLSVAVDVLPNYDFTQRASHRFQVQSNLLNDAEVSNDSLTYVIINSIKTTKSIEGPICPFTPITITAVSGIFNNLLWEVNGSTTNVTSLALNPSVTTVVKIRGTDYRGCAISDSLIVEVKSIGLPPTPVILGDVVLSHTNGFKTTLTIDALSDHTVNWIGDGTVINGGLGYVVQGFRGINPENHTAYYRNNLTACGSSPANITTSFGTGILMNNNTPETVCATNFYDSGNAFGPNNGNDNFTKTFFPATAGAKLKLSIYAIILGQFSSMRIYDGTDVNAPLIGNLDRLSANSLSEYMASNADGAITITFRANSSTSSGWLAGITCEQPLQFKSVANGSFTDPIIWESKLPASANYVPATRRPFKGDDLVSISHAVVMPTNTTIPLGQTIVETAGVLTVPATASVLIYTGGTTYDLSVNGGLDVGGQIRSDQSQNGKIALMGTLNLTGGIDVDTVVVNPNVLVANIIALGSANISRLKVNNPNGVNLTGNLSITKMLDLQNGLLNVSNGNYIILVSGFGSSLKGGSANSYVNGKLRRQSFPTSDTLQFPVGKNGIYRKIGLLANQSDFDNSVEYEAELFPTVPTSRTLPIGVNSINQQWYHKLNIISGASRFSDGTVTIDYQTADGVTDLANLRIVKDEGVNWIDIGANATLETVSSDAVTTLGDFVLGNVDPGTLPVNLIRFNAEIIDRYAQLNWQVAHEISFSGYEIERSVDGKIFEKIGKVDGIGANGLINYDYKDFNLTNNTIYYYRLKMIDADGKFKYSNLVSVATKGLMAKADVRIAPNPFIDRFTVNYQSSESENIKIQLIDLTGRMIKEHNYQVVKGLNEIAILTGELPKATYLVKLISKNGMVVEKVMKK
ncbi:hypothetical protein A5893_06540 [Pedobacter psychrophilus]|uniref:Secretion system C-terminal sorting domain-containing protein n=1 Tax=Pedobacter psychrophilus TaxID=1826909 RepID=A0A179DHP7_9SPHI|nr:T9SS type A sorting domain-containing protein [Pedobacter psychrophilus]OAQ40597.1 hypothetical protein A5893_06540 [Pedobacter psychrophilus]